MDECIDTDLVNNDKNEFKLIWNRLSYITGSNKLLINNLSGQVVSGELTAILGPSGSGKTTLIECIANKRKNGVSGQVWAQHNNRKSLNIRIAYNSQNDALIDVLTVEESLLYASQLINRNSKTYDFFEKNNNKNIIRLDTFPDETIERNLIEKRYHNEIQVNYIIDMMGLRQCAGVKAKQCSGGQRKRLSIGLELIFSPNILLLDEPTSGLDSVSCLQCLSVLKTLTNNSEPIIIAASVHQPSAKILSMFDNIYVLSKDGNCIYNGSTDKLIDHLSSLGLLCPIYHNPADFVIEIASGGHGSDAITTLVNTENNREIATQSSEESNLLSNIEYSSNLTATYQLTHIWILFNRCTLISIRDPTIYWLRLLGCVMSLGTKYFIYYKTDIGESEGCFNTTSLASTLKTITSDSGIENIYKKNLPNISYLLTLVMFTYFVVVAPTLMSFPLELSTFVKEQFNKWYTNWSFYWAKSLSDIPSVLIFPIIYSTLLYIMTDQTSEMWRFTAHILIIILYSILCHSIGLLISVYFINRMNASLIVFGVTTFPFILFSGFLIPINKIPKILQPLTYTSVFRLSLESLLLVIYGFNRCKQSSIGITVDEISNQFGVNFNQINDCFSRGDGFPNMTIGLDNLNNYLLNSNPSTVLNYFDLEERVLYLNIFLMIFYTICLRVCGYYVLKCKTKVK